MKPLIEPLPTSVEIDVLPSLRLITAIAWGVLSLSLLAFLDDTASVNVYSVLLWLFFSAMWLYWYAGGRSTLKENHYLLAGLVLTSVMPILLEGLAIYIYMRRDLGEVAVELNGSALYVWLIAPLVAISMRYRYIVLITFTTGTSLGAYIVGLWAQAAYALPIDARVEIAVTRWILFSISGLVIVQMSNTQRRLRLALIEKNTQLVHYAATQEQLATTRERNRLARDLHDTLAHTLSGIEIQLKALEVLLRSDLDAARQTLKQTRAHTRHGLQSARRALHDLRARPLEELGLRLALQRLAKQAADRAGVTLELQINTQLHELSPSAEQQLYRIAEESLNNAVRHANATHFEVALKNQGQHCVLRIKDNGRGFDPEMPVEEGHFGLQGIRERAALIHASISIESQPRHGTCIQVVVVGED
ncbi:MAG: sensor histidine kinase [Chloroflexota bacterium]